MDKKVILPMAIGITLVHRKRKNKMENTIWIEDQFLKADRLYENEKYAECKGLLTGMLDDEPGCGKAHSLLGWLYYTQLDDYERAVQHIKLALKFAPAYPAPFVNYLYLLNYLNRHEELLGHAEQALKVEGVSRFLVHREIGKSYERSGHLKKALKAHKESLRFAISSDELEQAEGNMNRVKKKIELFSK